MIKKLLLFSFFSLALGFIVLSFKPSEVNAACGGSGCCCERSRLDNCPRDCTQTSCGCQRVCAEAIQCGWACQAIGSICGVPCQGEGWVTSSSCTGTPGGGGNPPPPPPPPGSGGCTSGDCFTGISNCGEVGRVGGSGSCSGGLCCAVNTGGGGTTPFGCVMQTNVRNSASAVSYSFGVGQEIFACLYADGDGLITRMTAASQNTGVVQYSGTRSWDGTSYLIENATYCPGPRGTTVGGGTTRFTMRVYGKKCPACAEELMCQANTNLITVQGAPPSPPTVDLRANGSASAITIARGSSFTLSWSTANATSCTASGGWSGTQATSGSIQSSALQTTTSYSLSCTGPGGSASDSITVNVQAPTPAPTPVPAPTVDLRVNGGNGPITVTPGTNVTLQWSSTNATSCTASGGWSGGKAINGSQSQTVSGTSTYTLNCTGPGGTRSDSVTVNTSSPPTVNLLVNGGNGPVGITSGQSVSLSWTSSNASGCTASGGWSGSKATSGSQSVGPLTSSTTFSITCTGTGGSASDSVSVNVSANAPTVNLLINGGNGPVTVTRGGSATLSWSTTNATGCTASGGWSGSKATSGSQSITNITASTTYGISCTGPGGSSSDSVSVNVSTPAPTVNLTVNGGNGPITITSGSSINLAWSTTNATTCTASGGWSGGKAVPSGSQTVTNVTASQNYILGCTGPGGNASDTVTVQVAAAPTPPPVPSVDLRVNGGNGPVNISQGGSISLSWTSSNVTSCSATGGWSGSKAVPSGSQTISNITASTTYTIGCTGPGGNTSDSVSVAINATPAATVDLRVNGSNGPVNIASGSRITLSWSTTNATSCVASGGWSGNQATSGSIQSNPLTSNTTYNISCTGPGGSSSDSVSVTIASAAQCSPPQPRDPPTTTCAPNSSTNGSITWQWNPVAGATEYDIDIVNASTNTVVINNGFRPATDFNCASGICRYTTNHLPGTAYRSAIIARGSCTASSTAVSSPVTIPTCAVSNPPTVDIRANGANAVTIPSGTSATVSWSSTNATSCTLSSSGSSGGVAVSGSVSTGALTAARTYSITCTGSGGNASDSVTISVGAPPAPAPTVDLRVNNSNGPLTITAGTAVTVSWSSTNATSCSASASIATTGWTGAKAVSGSQSLTGINSTRTLNIACTGAGGNVSDAVTINVNAAPPPVCDQPAPRDPPDVTCAASGGNGTVVWQWESVANANSYEVDILDSAGNVVIDNGFLPAGNFGCAGGPPALCRYQTNLPVGTYRSRVIARGTCTQSPAGLSQLINVPACMTCSVNLAPDPLRVDAGQDATLVAQSSVTNGTANSVAFSSSDASVASVTSPDNSSPFTSTLTGQRAGNAVITATLTATNSLSETCTATDTLNAQILPPSPWWQAVGADVTTGGDLRSMIPATCGAPCVPYLIRNPNQGTVGIAVYGQSASYDFSSGPTQGRASVPGWLAQTGVALQNYNYESLYSLVSAQTFQTPGANLDSGTPDSEGYIWYRQTGDLNINTATPITRKVILFVEGDLRINQPIGVINRGSGLFLAIVRGNIIISGSVANIGGIGGISPIQGLFVANGQLRTGASNQQLTIRGSVAAYGGFDLQRDLENRNTDTPAEVFEYAPEMLLLIPSRLVKQTVIWREVVP